MTNSNSAETGARPIPDVEDTSANAPVTVSGNLRATLRAGLRVSLLLRPTITGLRFSAGVFWVAALASVLCAFTQAYFAAEAPRQFVPAAFESEALDLLLTLLVSYVLARVFAREYWLWPIAILMTWASLVTGTIDSLIDDYVLPYWAGDDDRGYWLWYAVMLVWWVSIVMRILSALGAGGSVSRRVLASAVAVGFMALPALLIPPSRFWSEADDTAGQAQSDQPPLIAEEVFSQQRALLDDALARVAPSQVGRPNLYFVAFAPDGDQDVFLKEIRYATKLFETRFGAARRTLMFSNNRGTLDELPMATATNLEQALKAIGRRMNLDDDILFLFLTSHGSEDAELSVQLEDLSFRPLSADGLAAMFKASGIRWKVIVVSACYSGSFIDALKDDHTLIITAARADRTSFGCADDADFTYFGRAYFQRALAHTSSFTEAFAKAQALVAEWETRDHETHSEPQIASSPLIEAKLARWREALAETSNIASGSATGNGPLLTAAAAAPRNCKTSTDCGGATRSQ